MQGDVSFTFLDRIEEVELNIVDGRWQSALALALTLPDICGGIAFPEIVKHYRDGRVMPVSYTHLGLPEFIEKTTEIQSWLKSKSKEELKTIWKCNDKITEQNFNRLENMDLYHLLTPAVL